MAAQKPYNTVNANLTTETITELGAAITGVTPAGATQIVTETYLDAPSDYYTKISIVDGTTVTTKILDHQTDTVVGALPGTATRVAGGGSSTAPAFMGVRCYDGGNPVADAVYVFGIFTGTVPAFVYYDTDTFAVVAAPTFVDCPGNTHDIFNILPAAGSVSVGGNGLSYSATLVMQVGATYNIATDSGVADGVPVPVGFSTGDFLNTSDSIPYQAIGNTQWVVTSIEDQPTTTGFNSDFNGDFF